MMKRPSASVDRTLFLVLLSFEILHLFFLVLSRRLPLGHDGFQYFSMEYFFLNDTAVNGEVPLWIPYMNHGITATWWYTIQGSVGLLTNALFLAGRRIASVNFLDIFHCGIFVDRLLLLTGVWLLGRRYFESAWTRFFVASCVMGSTVTMTQFNFTLHLYYAIPLLFFLGHAFLDTGRWRSFFLACNLFMIQSFGKNADTFPVITLTIFLYFLFYALDQPSQFRGQIKNLRWGFSSAAAIGGGLLSLGLLAAVFTAGRDPAMVNLNAGRALNSSVPLDIFLTYAGNMDFHKWLELLLRLSPSLDFSVYMGFLAVPLVFFGALYHPNRNKYPLLLAALVLLFFSMGTWVSVFFYYTWPMMKFYRHLALIVPIVKLLLLFLAGFGFEQLFVMRDTWKGEKKVVYGCLLAGALFMALSMMLSQAELHGHEASRFIVRFLTVQTSQTPSTFDPYTVGQRLGRASLYAMLAGCVFLGLPLVPLKKSGTAVILIVLLINALDIYGYYCTEMNERTFVLNKDQYKITAFSQMPYALRRAVGIPSPRQPVLLSPVKKFVLYATVNAFLFQDALATRFRTIVRMKPLQEMLSAFGQKPVEDPVFLKIAGSSVDKIQFFSRACPGGDDRQLVSYLSDPAYRGDVLFVSGQAANFVPACPGQGILTANDRTSVPYQIRGFTPNTLTVSANVPSAKPVWMMYSDVWHRGWTARVNDRIVPVFKADMAYKAVLLPPGKNMVRFAFVAPKLAFLEHVISMNALLWLFILLYLAFVF